jgi:hypothetical protein
MNHNDPSISGKNIVSSETLLEDIGKTITEGRKRTKNAMRAIVPITFGFIAYVGYFLSFVGDHNPAPNQYRISFYLTGVIGFMMLVLVTMVLVGGPFSRAILREIPRSMEKKSVQRSALVTACICGFLALLLVLSQLTDLMTLPVYAYAVITAGFCTGLYIEIRTGKDKGLATRIIKGFKEETKRNLLGATSLILEIIFVFAFPAVSMFTRSSILFSTETITLTLLLLLLIPFSFAFAILQLAIYEFTIIVDKMESLRTEISKNISNKNYTKFKKKWLAIKNG